MCLFVPLPLSKPVTLPESQSPTIKLSRDVVSQRLAKSRQDLKLVRMQREHVSQEQEKLVKEQQAREAAESALERERTARIALERQIEAVNAMQRDRSRDRSRDRDRDRESDHGRLRRDDGSQRIIPRQDRKQRSIHSRLQPTVRTIEGMRSDRPSPGRQRR